jgi:hydrogenase maturation protease
VIPAPPLLVVAVGNQSRGDDALGPALLDALRESGVGRDAQVELLADFQLQVEHALDLVGRDAVLFVDAARGAVRDGAELVRIKASGGDPPHSHALRPQAVLAVYARVQAGPAPPAWLLAIGGESFELGAGLSPRAQANLAKATHLAQDWLIQHVRAGAAPHRAT